MMDLQSLAKILAVTCCGIFSGAALYVTLVEHPARMECGTQLAATQFGPSYRRAAIMQALLTVVGSLLAALVWVRDGSTAWLAGAALFVSVVPYTLLDILPTNKQLLDASLDRSSQHARALLVRWSHLHVVRTVVGLVAFIFFLYLIAAGK
jgi:uncharacterized membrane protein